MKKYIDVKVTIWGRLHFKDDADLNKLIELLEQGNTTSDLCDEELGFSEYEILYDTEEELSPEENIGDATIEVFDEDVDKYTPLWTNTKENGNK